MTGGNDGSGLRPWCYRLHFDVRHHSYHSREGEFRGVRDSSLCIWQRNWGDITTCGLVRHGTGRIGFSSLISPSHLMNMNNESLLFD